MAIIPDWTLFLQMANFIVLIQGLEDGISGAKQQAEESGKAFQAKMSDARMKGMEKKEALKQEAQEEQKKILDELNEKAQQELQTVKAQIAKDTEAARKKLSGEVKGFAGIVAEKILGRAVA